MPRLPRRDLEGCDADIAKGYLRSVVQTLKKIKAAIDANAMAELEHLSHRLAGTSAFLELAAFAKLLRDMEHDAAAGRRGKARQLVRSLDEEFSQIQRHVAPRFSKTRARRATSTLSETKNQIKLMIVDDHALMREGLKRLIGLHPEFHVCGEAATASQAMAALSICRPNIVLLDISLGGADGIQLIKGLRRGPRPPLILVLSVHKESSYIERALRAGAQGYVMKHEAAKQLMNAIHRLLAGEIYVSKSLPATASQQ